MRILHPIVHTDRAAPTTSGITPACPQRVQPHFPNQKPPNQLRSPTPCNQITNICPPEAVSGCITMQASCGPNMHAGQASPYA